MIPWLHGAFVHRHQDSVGSNESSDLKMKAWENLHRSANASQIATRHKHCAAVNGRKPAMRISERVGPTAGLTPAPHKMCNKLLKCASYRCCCMQVGSFELIIPVCGIAHPAYNLRRPSASPGG